MDSVHVFCIAEIIGSYLYKFKIKYMLNIGVSTLTH